MSFNQSEHIGRPAPGNKKIGGVIYRAVLGGSATGGSGFGAYSSINADTRVINNIPDAVKLVVKLEWRLRNTSTAWSTANWDGSVSAQLFNGDQSNDWEFIESANCEAGNQINNDFLFIMIDEKPAGESDTANCFFSVSADPTTFSTCPGTVNNWRCTVTYHFPNITEQQISELVFGNPAPLLSFERIQ